MPPVDQSWGRLRPFNCASFQARWVRNRCGPGQLKTPRNRAVGLDVLRADRPRLTPEWRGFCTQDGKRHARATLRHALNGYRQWPSRPEVPAHVRSWRVPVPQAHRASTRREVMHTRCDVDSAFNGKERALMREILGRRRRFRFWRSERAAQLGAALTCATRWKWPVLPGVGLAAGGRGCACPDAECVVPGAHPFDPRCSRPPPTSG